MDDNLKNIDLAIKSKEKARNDYVKEARMAMQQNSAIARFGEKTQILCQEIKANVGKFSAPPIGPAGFYIHLTDEAVENNQLNDLIHVELGPRLLNTFLVNDNRDATILRKICKDIGMYNIPQIHVAER